MIFEGQNALDGVFQFNMINVGVDTSDLRQAVSIRTQYKEEHFKQQEDEIVLLGDLKKERLASEISIKNPDIGVQTEGLGKWVDLDELKKQEEMEQTFQAYKDLH